MILNKRPHPHSWCSVSVAMNGKHTHYTITLETKGCRGEYINLKRIFRCTVTINDNESSAHYGDVIRSARASQITILTIVYSTVYSDADRRKHQSSASLALVRGFHRWPVNSPHKRPVTRKMFPFDDVIMRLYLYSTSTGPQLREVQSLKWITAYDI